MTKQLRAMIDAQPDALRELAGFDVSAFAERLRPARRLHVVGTGTSFHAAELGAYLLRAGNLDAEAIPCAEYARWRPHLGSDVGLIVITHTGETAYARAIRAAALEAGTPLVTITGPQVEWDEALRTRTKEQSETYTVSYTAALGALGLLAHALTGVETDGAALVRTAERVAAVLNDPGISEVREPKRVMVLVGCGIWAVTAREGALKIRESSRMLAEGYDSELLLHGSAVPLGADDALVAVEPEADRDGLTAAVVRAADESGISTHVLGDGAGAGTAAESFLAQIPATVRLQLLAAQLADARGQDADHVITGPWEHEPLWEAGAPAS